MERKGVFDRIIDSLAYVGGILMGMVVLIKFSDIILRYFFSKPLTWDIEVTEYILFLSTFFGAAWLLKQDGHVRIDVLDTILSKKNRMKLRLFHSATGALVSIILCVVSLMAALYSYRDDLKVIKIYAIDKYYFLLIISLGYLLLLIEFLRQFFTGIHTIRDLIHPERGIE